MTDPGPTSRSIDRSIETEQHLKNKHGGLYTSSSHGGFPGQELLKRLLSGYFVATVLGVGSYMAVAWLFRALGMLSVAQFELVVNNAWWYVTVPVILLLVLIPVFWPLIITPITCGVVYYWFFKKEFISVTRSGVFEHKAIAKKLVPLNLAFAFIPLLFILTQAFLGLKLNPFTIVPNPELLQTLLISASLLALISAFSYIASTYYACKGPVNRLMQLRRLGQSGDSPNH